jgi:hypothetical protein
MKKKNRILLIVLALTLIISVAADITTTAYSQNNVVIGAKSGNSNALLDIISTNKGILVPRMTALQRVYIAADTLSPGLIIYQIDDEAGFYYFTGKSWTRLVAASDLTSGNITLPNLAAVATTGSYCDLQNTPEIPVQLSDMEQDAKYYTAITKEERDLWNVMEESNSFSGNYYDLTDKPNIPDSINDLLQDSDYYTTVNNTEKIIWNKKLEKNNISLKIQDYIQDTLNTLVTAIERERWNTAAARSTFTGDYKDLVDKPELAVFATTGQYIDLINTPSISATITNDTTPIILAKVAYTGDYTDLLGRPVFTNKDGETIILHRVATSGSYHDLINTPYIPSTLAEMEQDTDYIMLVTKQEKEIWNGKIETSALPRTLEDLRDDSTHRTVSQRQYEKWNEAAINYFDGKYENLQNKPDFAAVAFNGTDNIDYLVNIPTRANIEDFLNLSPVATTGNYYDLQNTPNIPSVLKELEQDSMHRLLTEQQIVRYNRFKAQWDEHKNHLIFDGDYNDAHLNNKPLVSTFATTGRFLDLTDRPTAQELINVAGIKNIALTGKYNDLNVSASGYTLDTILGLCSGVFQWDNALQYNAQNSSQNEYYSKYIPSGINAGITTIWNNAPIPSFTKPINVNPSAEDTAVIGTSMAYARADHTHQFFNAFPDITPTPSAMATSKVINLKYVDMFFGQTGWIDGCVTVLPRLVTGYGLTIKSGTTFTSPSVQREISFITITPANRTEKQNLPVTISTLKNTIYQKTQTAVEQLREKYDNDQTGMANTNDFYRALPVGSVVMYKGNLNNVVKTDGCWEHFSAMDGKFPVGEGGNDNDGKSYKPYKSTDENNESGKTRVYIEPKHIPPHSHHLLDRTYKEVDDNTENDKDKAVLVQKEFSSSGAYPYSFSTQNMNGNNPSNQPANYRNNLPPYFGIYFIRKTKNECN